MPDQNFDLSIRHEDYMETARVRHDSHEFYEGDDIEMMQYIEQGMYEEKPFFIRRQKKMVYENLLQAIVNARAGLLTRKQPKMKLTKEVSDFTDNVDGFHTKSHAFLKSVIIHADVDGIAWVKVDKPNISALQAESGGIVSKETELRLGIRPYLEWISAEKVINWEYDPHDRQLLWLIMEIERPTVRLPGVKSESQKQWVLWTRDFFQVWMKAGPKKDTFAVIEEGINTTGVVPFVPFYGIKKKEFVGLPFGKQLLTHLKRILNLENQIDYSLEMINLARMYIIADRKPEEMPTANEAFYLPIGQNGEKPEIGFAEPTGKGIELSEGRVANLIGRVYRIALHLNRNATAQVQSGDAQREETTILKADLSSSATNHEGSWKRVWELMHLWQTGEAPKKGDIEVEFVKDYDVRKSQPPEILSLIALYDSGLLSSESIWERLIEGEILPENFSSEEEIKRIQNDEVRKEKSQKTLTPGVPRESNPDEGLRVDGQVEKQRQQQADERQT